MAEKQIFNMRITEEEKQIIEKYSEKDRRTMSSFVLNATMEKIESMIRKEKEE